MRSAWTNKLITAKDHAAVQINIGHINEEGMYTGNSTTFAFSGSVRAMVGLFLTIYHLACCGSSMIAAVEITRSPRKFDKAEPLRSASSFA